MKKLLIVPLAALVLAGCSGKAEKPDAMAASDQMMKTMAFSGPDSVAYSQKLWTAIGDAKLVGAKISGNAPYKGVHPHGAVLTTDTSTVKIGAYEGQVIVKKNFRGEDVSIDGVNADPARYLKSVTVMYKREAGYDPENMDWFWAKYKPDGVLFQNDKGMQLAGRVAKGKPVGCIACHTAAPGGDYIYTN